MYVSFDDGGVWQPLQSGLPVTPVHGIQIKNDDIVIGTHGRSFYLMQNIGVLRQITRETTNDAVVLFDPSDAVRSISTGVAIDYYLKQPADKITIEILDAQSQTIATFSGPPAPAAGRGGRGDAPAAGEDEEGGGRGATPPQVGGGRGMNRFSWDMRYPGARDFPGLILWAGGTRGPVAPPGRYQARLTANGVTRSQDFSIVRNAAVRTVSDADLLAQFTLAKQINDKVSVANEAVLRIRSLKSQIAERLSSAAGTSAKPSNPSKASKTLDAAGKSLTEQLTSVEGELYQYRNRSSQDPLNYPIRLNNKLAALQGVVENGSNRPTDQAYAVFKDLSARVDKELARLDALVKSELPPLNAQLKRLKARPIEDAAPGTR
jgi:hypothetical protein